MRQTFPLGNPNRNPFPAPHQTLLDCRSLSSQSFLNDVTKAFGLRTLESRMSVMALCLGHSSRHVSPRGLLMLPRDDMSARLSHREPLNVAAELGRDLLEAEIF